MTLTEDLARHFAEVEASDLPDASLHEMKRLLLDYLGVALCGSQSESGIIAGDFAVDEGGRPDATVLGRPGRVPATLAAFANGISSHSVELDDIDDLALFHHAPPVYSAALAVGQRVHASGADVLTAALLGCEMMTRLSLATNPSLRNRGFHTTPTCGVFGAAVAAGRLLGLSAAQVTSALGLAGAQASGLMEMYGTSMQKRFNAGPPARNGVTAALLAAQGFTGADTILEGTRGFAAAFSDSFDADALIAGLGTEMPVRLEYKPYSSARPIHNAIDCALTMRREHGLTAAHIEKVTMYRHPTWAKYHDIARPRTFHEAQMSLPYSVAVAIVEGQALPAQYQEPHLSDETVLGLAAKVTIVEDASLARGVSCRMEAVCTDGTVRSTVVDYPRGSSGNPMTDADLVGKFTMLAVPVIGTELAERVVEQVFDVQAIVDVNQLVDQLATSVRA